MTITVSFKKSKEAFHDAQLYRLYHKVGDEIEGRGAKVVRVRLDYKIKRGTTPVPRVVRAAAFCTEA